MKKLNKIFLFIDEHLMEVEPIMDVLSEQYGSDKLEHFQSSSLAINFIKENHERIMAISLDILMPYQLLKDEKAKKEFELEGLAVLDFLYKNYKEIDVVCYSWVYEPEIISLIESKGAKYLYKPDKDSYFELINIFRNHYKINFD